MTYWNGQLTLLKSVTLTVMEKKSYLLPVTESNGRTMLLFHNFLFQMQPSIPFANLVLDGFLKTAPSVFHIRITEFGAIF